MRRFVALVALALTLAGSGLAAVTSPGTALIAGIPQRGTVLGKASAPVTLIQYEDLGCPHCLTYMTDAFPTIVREYVRTGKVKVDFRGLGIVTPASLPALRYALAAGRQNKLWQVVGRYYDKQDQLDGLVGDAAVRKLVRGLKLNVPKLLRDARSAAITRQVNALLREAVRREVPGTPWFFVRLRSGELRLVQPSEFSGEAFRSILDQALDA